VNVTADLTRMAKVSASMDITSVVTNVMAALAALALTLPWNDPWHTVCGVGICLAAACNLYSAFLAAKTRRRLMDEVGLTGMRITSGMRAAANRHRMGGHL
jgi:hypothetical protein